MCDELDPTEEHLQRCEACRQLMATHSALLKFNADRPSPKLSEGFNVRLLNQVEQARRRTAVRPPASWLLKSYWALATVASLVLLFRIELGDGLDQSWVVILSTMAIGSFALLGLLPVRHAKKIAAYFGL